MAGDGGGWWSRLLGRTPAPPAVVRPAAAPPGAAMGPGPTPSPDAGAAVRRPLVARQGRVGGFEWLLPAPVLQRLAAAPDGAAAVAHHTGLLSNAAAQALPQRPALVCLSAALLSRPALQAAARRDLWLCTPTPLAEGDAQVIRARGARVGLLDAAPGAGAAPDFVVMLAAAGGLDTLQLAAERWREQQPGTTLVALGLPHLEAVEQALRVGFHLAGGALTRGAGKAAPGTLGADARRVCELLNHIALDSDNAVVAAAVRSDVALSLRLLRYANSPAMGLTRAADSVEQALALLGRAELRRCLQLMLLSLAASRPAGRALQENALVRARLLELLAQRRGERDAGVFFTLGLLSTIDLLMQLPLGAALAPLRLSDEMAGALLQRQGPLALQLALLDGIEASDESLAWTAAAQLGHAEHLAPDLEAAWAWAELWAAR
jgi:c-di-GMP phosphodiesterase